MINRRRAPSSEISSNKKVKGHETEEIYSKLINGAVIKGTQKGDVVDVSGKLHSIKSGKKWQIFLYSYNRIYSCNYLKILLPSLEAFPEDSIKYFKDREECISFKENYVKNNGREAAKLLANETVIKALGNNSYIQAKTKLSETTSSICNQLAKKAFLHEFLNEAIFNKDEVAFLAIKDSTYLSDGLFKVFTKKDVLNVLCDNLHPKMSKAGNVPEDYNVPGQKSLLCYQKNGKSKNIIEIEIRNDEKHYREVRFNMYSKDALFLLCNNFNFKKFNNEILLFGNAIKDFKTTK